MNKQKKMFKYNQVEDKRSAGKRTIPKQDWPIGHLPYAPTEQRKGETPVDDGQDRHKDNGFDEWSVSWP